MVLSGIRDGLDLCGRILLTPRDKVLIEDPGYVNAVPIYRPYTSSIVPLPIDDQGFAVARARRLRGVKLVHVTPAHQSPTGITMPCRAAWNCWTGPRRPASGSWRTTMTASSTTTARRWRP